MYAQRLRDAKEAIIKTLDANSPLEGYSARLNLVSNNIQE